MSCCVCMWFVVGGGGWAGLEWNGGELLGPNPNHTTPPNPTHNPTTHTHKPPKKNKKKKTQRVGVKNMARGASVVLLLNYLSAIAEGVINRGGAFRPAVMVGGHGVLAVLLLNRFRKLNAESLVEIKAYYKFIWDLFYLEYLMYPFM